MDLPTRSKRNFALRAPEQDASAFDGVCLLRDALWCQRSKDSERAKSLSPNLYLETITKKSIAHYRGKMSPASQGFFFLQAPVKPPKKIDA